MHRPVVDVSWQNIFQPRLFSGLRQSALQLSPRSDEDTGFGPDLAETPGIDVGKRPLFKIPWGDPELIRFANACSECAQSF